MKVLISLEVLMGTTSWCSSCGRTPTRSVSQQVPSTPTYWHTTGVPLAYHWRVQAEGEDVLVSMTYPLPSYVW